MPDPLPDVGWSSRPDPLHDERSEPWRGDDDSISGDGCEPSARDAHGAGASGEPRRGGELSPGLALGPTRIVVERSEVVQVSVAGVLFVVNAIRFAERCGRRPPAGVGKK